MTTKNQVRCKDCAYLVKGECGKWTCEDAGEKDIEKIPDEECSMNCDW